MLDLSQHVRDLAASYLVLANKGSPVTIKKAFIQHDLCLNHLHNGLVFVIVVDFKLDSLRVLLSHLFCFTAHEVKLECLGKL